MHSEKKRALIAPLVLWGLVSIGGCAAHTHGYVYVGTPPPAPVVEVVGVSPGYGYVWVPGYYRWGGRSYYWERGRWSRAPHGRSVWVPGRWHRGRRGWYWERGYWR